MAAWLATGVFISLLADPEQEKLGISLLGIGEVLGLGIVATLAARVVPEPQRERLGLQGFELSVLPALLLLLPMTVLVSELVNVAQLLFPPPDAGAVAQRTLERLSTASPLQTIETVIVVVGLAPIVEEWLYRGVLQQGLVAHLGRLGGVLAVACLFGLSHLEPSLSPASSLATFIAILPLGLALGAVRLATGSVLASMLLHAGYNAVSLTSIALADRVPIPGFNAPGDHTPAWLLLVSSVLVTVALSAVVRAARAAPVALPLPAPEEEADESGSDATR